MKLHMKCVFLIGLLLFASAITVAYPRHKLRIVEKSREPEIKRAKNQESRN